MTYITVGVTLCVLGGPSEIFKVRSVIFVVTLLLLRHTEHQRGMEMTRAVYMVIRQKLFQS